MSDQAADCAACDRPNSEEDMVQCGRCPKWFQYSCADVDASVKKMEWACKECTDPDLTIRNEAQCLEADRGGCKSTPTATQSRRTVNHGDAGPEKASTSIRSTTTRRSRIKLELLHLEEQRKLNAMFQEQRQKQEEEYLRKKFEIMAREDEDEAPSIDGSLARSRTLDWVTKTQPEVPNKVRSDAKVKQMEWRFEKLPQKEEEVVFLDQRQISARQVVGKELPVFNGKPEEWPLFISSYENTTKLCGFSNAENLARLQKAIKGDALVLLDQLVMPSDVPEAINTLRMLYGRPQYVVQMLLKQIRAEPLPKIERLDTIIKYALSVRSLHSTIVASGLSNHLNDATLLTELVERLPAQIKLNWGMECGTFESDLTQFSEWLYKIAEGASSVTTFVPAEKRNLFPDRRNDKRPAHIHAAHSEDRMKANVIPPNNKRGGCYSCGKEHKLVECEKFKQLSLEKRRELTESRSICEMCLGHSKKFKCRNGRACSVSGCVGKHHTLLHSWPKYLQQPATAPVQAQTAGNLSAHQHAKDRHTFFGILPVTLYGNGKSLETFAFLDNGSSLTLVDESEANSLGLSGVTKPLCLKWTSDTVRLEEDSKVVPMEISASSDDLKGRKYWLRDVRTVKNLALPLQSVDMQQLQKKYSHLGGVPLQSYKDAKCGILIGLSNQKLLLGRRVREGNWSDPVAILTRLGWCVSGGNVEETKVNGMYHVYEACECDKDLHEMIRQHFVLEDHGIDKKHIESAEELRAKKFLKASVKRKGDSFCAGLLWRYDDFVLPDSYPMALKRLKCLEKKMAADPSLLEAVNGKINNLLTKGYVRRLTPEELKEHHPKTWYLPIFIVKNPNKPGKVRLVWDAAASTQGVSLNNMLLKGPDALRVLVELLHNFRTRPVAVIADIEEMFLQVGIEEKDQHAQRFIYRFGDTDYEPIIFMVLVLPFGETCAPSIAEEVKNVNAMEFAGIFPEAAEAIVNNHYVDDWLDSFDDDDKAIQLAQEVKFVHSKGGFNIRNWVSNSKKFLKAFGQPECEGKTIQDNSDEMKSTTKILGLWWNTEKDIFTFSLRFNKAHEDVLNGQRVPTKRELLRVLMSIYDPLGFLSFYLVRLKVLLQEVWRSAIEWDELIPQYLECKWEDWRHLLPKVENVEIQRCYLPQGFGKEVSIQLHIFVDASEDAMAAVAYLRYQYGSSVDCTLVCAKSKVAPLKPLSIPKMELQAALIGSRLANSIEKSHKIKIEKRFLWTDSRNVLSWLRADAKKFKPFVMFRIVEILDNTKREEWRWVPTKMNVADEATKWAKLPTFGKNDRWFKGPDFLYDDEDGWPNTAVDKQLQTEELRAQFLLLTDVILDGPLIDVHRFATWKRLHRSMAWVVRACNIWTHQRSGLWDSWAILTAEELQHAEVMIIQLAQQDRYGDELALLKNGKLLPKSSQLYKLSPYLDNNGVLRIRGRIDSAWCVNEDTKRPIILPRDHYVSVLVVRDYHSKFHHRCQETVVNEVRQRFWVPRLRTLVRSVRLECKKCRIDKVVPEVPEMAPLPEARLAAYVRPFTFTGVDYFGPILVKNGRKTEKRWGVLFTCLTIRAIHLEMAHNLTSDSCIMCVRRFMSRRGTPREIYSDNGTNLKGAEKELREAFHQMNKDVIQITFTSAETRWYFNPPAAPHMGGCWERLIGSVKSVLKEVTRNQRLEDESLLSFLIEVEGIINARPLTHVSVEADDEEALTPNHFLLGSSSGSKPPGEFTDQDLLLRKNWRISQRLSHMFWRRWVREYSPTLTRRTKWFEQVRNIAEGDVVIIVDENLPRSSWPKGIVVSTINSKDGQIRRATVRTASGVYDRPVARLAVLDVSKSSEGEAATEAAASQRGRNVADALNAATALRSSTDVVVHR